MHKQTIAILLTAILVALTFAMPIIAQPVTQGVQVQITAPEMGEQLRGQVAIMGSASVGSFQFYKVEFGVGPNPQQWAVIGELHDSPVINGQLAIWDTAAMPDGVYTLRLQAVKQDGNWEEFLVRQVVVANTLPTNTPVPTVTATAEQAKATPTAKATPKATATLQIIAPTAALSMPTPTPTLSRPEQRSQLPIDPQAWGQSFLYGGGAMVAVFVVLGIVFAIRRLL
jgi:hypothetical protein